MNTTMPNEIPDLPEYATDLEAELAFGPGKCAAQEGVRRMEARIRGLIVELASASDAEQKQAIVRQLEDAQVRLAGYQMQLDMKN